MSITPAVWFPTVRTGTGTDVFTERLVKDLQASGVRAEITWLPLRAEYAPWSVPIPKPPEWATVAHVNTWLHPRFIPEHLPSVATIHHAIHHPNTRSYKGWPRTVYHEYWIASIERRIMRRADKVTAVSQFVADSARQTLIDVPMEVIYNGIDTEAFQPAHRLCKPTEPFRLLYVGSWMTRKGVDLLAPIMRELGEGFELRFTGGPAAKKDKTYMPPNMVDIGRLQGDVAVADAMQNADALLFPSRSEGHPLVAIEAMACGLPVIAFTETCLVEIVENGVTGNLVPLGNIIAITEAVRALAKNRTKLQSMSIAARQHVITKFGPHIMLDAYLDTYLAVLASDGYTE